MLESRLLRGMNGLKASSSTRPGNRSSEKLRRAIGNRPSRRDDLEMRHPHEGVAPCPGAEIPVAFGLVIPRQVAEIGAVEDAGIDHLSRPFRLDGEMGEAVRAPLVRLVEDLPVDHPPCTGQADRAGPDPAEREGDFRGRFTFVREWSRSRQRSPPTCFAWSLGRPRRLGFRKPPSENCEHNRRLFSSDRQSPGILRPSSSRL